MPANDEHKSPIQVIDRMMRLLEVLAVPFGAGIGMTFDEAALLLELDDVYWSREGLLSVQLSLAASAIMGSTILGLRMLRRGEQRSEEFGLIGEIDLWVARRLYDYSHLPREKGEGVRPWVLRGREEGRKWTFHWACGPRPSPAPLRACAGKSGPIRAMLLASALSTAAPTATPSAVAIRPLARMLSSSR